MEKVLDPSPYSSELIEPSLIESLLKESTSIFSLSRFFSSLGVMIFILLAILHLIPRAAMCLNLDGIIIIGILKHDDELLEALSLFRGSIYFDSFICDG